MAKRKLKVWFDSEGDYLEVIFDQNPGYLRETESDQVMEKVDDQGNILGFSVLRVSALKEPLEEALCRLISLDDERVKREAFKTLLPLYSLKAAPK